MSNKYKVLHLDDSLLFLEFTKMILDMPELSYKPVSTIEEVEKYFNKNKPDLFISDLMLYDESNTDPGIKLIEEIHEKYPDIKIMILSARGDKYLKERLKNKIVYYATKNLRDTKIKSIVLNLLKGEKI